MKEKVLETIKKYNLIKDGDRLVLGVSGGPDSIAMLNILNDIKNDKKQHMNFDIIVAHVNHMIREEAIEDQKFVENFCKKIGVTFYAKSIDVQKIANNKNLFTLFNIAQNATPKAINNATNELKMTIQSENQLDSTTLYTYTPDDSDDPNEQNILDVIADNIEKYSHSDISMYYTPFHVPTLAELREIADDLHISINNLLCPEPFSPNEIKSNYFFCQLQQNDISAHFIAGNESKIVLSQNGMHYIIPSNLYDTFYSSLDDFFSLNVKTLILHAEKKYYSLSDAIYYCSLHKN